MHIPLGILSCQELLGKKPLPKDTLCVLKVLELESVSMYLVHCVLFLHLQLNCIVPAFDEEFLLKVCQLESFPVTSSL